MGPFCLDCRICGGVWACDTSPGSHTWLGFLLIVEPPLCPVPSPMSLTLPFYLLSIHLFLSPLSTCHSLSTCLSVCLSCLRSHLKPEYLWKRRPPLLFGPRHQSDWCICRGHLAPDWNGKMEDGGKRSWRKKKFGDTGLKFIFWTLSFLKLHHTYLIYT